MYHPISDIFVDKEYAEYGLYVGHTVVYFNEKLLDDITNKDFSSYKKDISIHFNYVANNPIDISRFDNIIREKVTEELNGGIYDYSKITAASDCSKLQYCVIASEVDYNSQDILQPDYSIKQKILELMSTNKNSGGYYYYHSDLTQKMEEIGIYKNKDEFAENLFESMVKANQLGYMKENLHEDGFDSDKYQFCVAPISIYETVPGQNDEKLITEVNEIYIAAKDIKKLNKYKDILIKKIQKESLVSFTNDVMLMCYSLAANSVDYDSQDVLQDDYSIIKHAKNDSIDVSFEKTPSFLGFGIYSDALKTLSEVGIYLNKEQLQQNYFEDMITMVKLGLDNSIEECCCAGGIGGGVTTASFAPAVTNTVYPKPNKKKKTKKESDETIDEIYGYYSCIVRIHLDFSGYSDNKVVKYYAVLAKTIDKIDEYNKKINENIKKISNDSCITSTTLSNILYSTEIKDFDFDGQKFLDSSLYTNDRMKFFQSEKILDEESRENHRIINDSFTNLSDFVDDLFSQMTEDADDVYWPVRNDETDAFEKKISDERQAKKDKIIARKEKVIKAREESLDRWLDFMTSKGVSLVVLKKEYDKAIKKIYKLKEDLRRIKSLPLTSPEFLSRNI